MQISPIGFGPVVLGGRRREAPSARIQGRGEESQADESTGKDGTRECFTFTTSFRRAMRVRTEESEEECALSFVKRASFGLQATLCTSCWCTYDKPTEIPHSICYG